MAAARSGTSHVNKSGDAGMRDLGRSDHRDCDPSNQVPLQLGGGILHSPSLWTSSPPRHQQGRDPLTMPDLVL